MGQRQRFTLSDLGGGLNEGAHFTQVLDNEMTTLRNWYPRATRLVRRNGLTQVSAVAFQEDLTNAFAYKTSVGDWTLIVGGKTLIGKLDGSSLVQIPFGAGQSAYTSSDKLWSFRQYKDVVYGARESIGTLQRITEGVVYDAGISAPSSAPTIAEGAAGNLPGGDYIGVVTFYNTETAAESNPSDNSSTLTLSSSKKIDWTSIPTSTNPQVNARRLYRTLADQDGAWFLVGQINDNISTTFTDNVTDNELGALASFDNGDPPTAPRINEVWQERMWLSDGRDLFFSGFGLPESYSEFDVISISPDDGHEVRGILAFADRLLVGKSNAMYAVTTIDGFSFRVTALSNEHGCMSHHSMKNAEGLAFWFGGDNFYQTDGVTVQPVGDIKIRDLIDSVDPSDYELVSGIVDETKSHYIATFPSLGKMAVYNYRDNTWSTYDFRGADTSLTAPSFLTNFFDTNLEPVLYCNLQGGEEAHILRFDSGNTDNGRDIECELVTKYFGFSEEQLAKLMGDIELKVVPVAENLDISVLGDDGLTLAGPVTINMFETRHWFRIPLATAGSPANGLALKLEFSGTKALDVLGVAFTITDLERRVPIARTV